MLYKFTCFWRTNSYSLAFKISHLYLGNLGHVNGKKLKDSVLINYLIALLIPIHNNKFKMKKGNNYTYTNELASSCLSRDLISRLESDTVFFFTFSSQMLLFL